MTNGTKTIQTSIDEITLAQSVTETLIRDVPSNIATLLLMAFDHAIQQCKDLDNDTATPAHDIHLEPLEG